MSLTIPSYFEVTKEAAAELSRIVNNITTELLAGLHHQVHLLVRGATVTLAVPDYGGDKCVIDAVLRSFDPSAGWVVRLSDDGLEASFSKPDSDLNTHLQATMKWQIAMIAAYLRNELSRKARALCDEGALVSLVPLSEQGVLNVYAATYDVVAVQRACQLVVSEVPGLAFTGNIHLLSFTWSDIAGSGS
ncbi:MAG: hypothetical protein SGJ27_31115 [Candidatus Melainabacteria bacterium]|nr:hypothetical protein [Candidatus Melainabacteria bacterium]